ncbi:MAG: hypothetical protein WBW71_00675, partial [Bacteroidota bacterium]
RPKDPFGEIVTRGFNPAANVAWVISSESVASCAGTMRALRKRLASDEGLCEPFSPACVVGKHRVGSDSPKGVLRTRCSLCFFLWLQRKKGNSLKVII